MDLRDMPEFQEICEDIERGMGVENPSSLDPMDVAMRRIHAVELLKITWRWRLWNDAPVCQICRQPIKDAAVLFQGPFVESLTGKLAACLDREKCNRQREEHKQKMAKRQIAQAIEAVKAIDVQSGDDRFSGILG